MKLTKSQKKEILINGYVRLPGLVRTEKVRAALDATKALMGGLAAGSEGAEPTPGIRRAWENLADGPAISALFHDTPIESIAESLLGKNCIAPDLQRTVLVRYPQPATARERTSFHIDGFEYHGGLFARDAPVHSHSLAAAVILSDAPDENVGNLALIPGSHAVLESHFRSHPESLDRRDMPAVALGAPISVKGLAGDVVIYHYQIAHSAFAFKNLSPNVHFAAVFWAKHVRHDERWREALTNLWLEWPGMADVLPKPTRRSAGGRR